MNKSHNIGHQLTIWKPNAKSEQKTLKQDCQDCFAVNNLDCGTEPGVVATGLAVEVALTKIPSRYRSWFRTGICHAPK